MIIQKNSRPVIGFKDIPRLKRNDAIFPEMGIITAAIGDCFAFDTGTLEGTALETNEAP